MGNCVSTEIFFLCYNHSMKDIFTVPITARGIIANNAFRRVAVTHGDAWDPILGYIFSILYAYGGEMYGMYPAVSKKVSKKWQGVLGYLRVPWISCEYRNKPFIMTKNQVAIFKTELKKLGYDFPFPYNYGDATGDTVRAAINPLLEKDKKTAAYVTWERDQKKWKKMIGMWHDLFYQQYQKQWDFKIKLYDYVKYVAFTIHDEKIDMLTKKSEIMARQKKHQELLNDFAMFLYDGFLNKKKGFGKCLYE